MSSSEQPETSGTPPPRYPAAASFVDLLDWHLNYGTRPTGDPDHPGKRWSIKEFAYAVGGVTERTVRNWRSARRRPHEIGTIEHVFFGNNDAYRQWRFDLRVAYDGNPTPVASRQDDLVRGLKANEVSDGLIRIERLKNLIRLKEELSPIAETHDVVSQELSRLFSDKKASNKTEIGNKIRAFSQSVARIVAIYGKYKYYFPDRARKEIDLAFSEAEDLSGRPTILQAAQNAIERFISALVAELDSLST